MLAKDAGFDGVEAALDKTGLISLESTQEDILSVKKIAEQVGVELHSVAFEPGSEVVHYDVGNVVYCGYPEHWINILGKRIKKITLRIIAVRQAV